MSSPIHYPADDKDLLDDAALWAVIDSAAASHSSIKSRKPLSLKYTNYQTTSPTANPAQVPKFSKNPRNQSNYQTMSHDARVLVDGEVLQEPWSHRRPQKMARSSISEVNEVSPLAVVKHVQRTPTTRMYSSPETGKYSVELSPVTGGSPFSFRQSEGGENFRHSLFGRFPSVSLFKEYQNAAMAILEKTDYTMISGNPYIKKSGWRKISFYFNLSYEIKDKTIEFDENRNVLRAEFVARAYMQGGRFSDGWGSCERREKRFSKPNHDIPSTAETRAKNKACQDLLGIGEYRPGAGHNMR